MDRLSAFELTRLLQSRELSPREVQDHFLARIEERNPELSCFLHVAREPLPESPAGPLYGLPVAFKDLTWVRGMPCTSGSLVYRDFVPEQESAVVERTRRAGGVVLGKTNTPELGYKGVTDNQLAPPCRNPWNLERTSGGSSGGAACAVAAGLAPLAEGTDGAGSIRIPASFCGVVGHKPTRGLVPRYPVPDSFYTLSHVGPIARDVRDCALFLDVLAGYDARDPLCSREARPGYLAGLEEPGRALRVAWSPDLGYATVPPATLERLAPAVAALGAEGVALDWEDPEPIELDLWALTYAGRYGEPDPRMHPELQEIIRAGSRLPASRAGEASQQRTVFYGRVHRLFEEYDLLLTPTLAQGAFCLDQQHPGETLFGWTPFTYPFNLTGHPALTVPVALDEDGMPLGLQIVGRLGADLDCLRAGAQVERTVKFSKL